MAALKVWDGTAWQVVGGAPQNPAVSAPLTSVGGVLGLPQATPATDGSFPAADKGKLDRVLFGPNGELLLHAVGAGGVGRYTRAAGPQQDVHLRSGPAAGSYAFLEAAINALVASNAYWDGTNWNRFDTGQPAMLSNVQGTTGTTFLQYAAAGANPITWLTVEQIDVLSGVTQRRNDSMSSLITASRHNHLTANLVYDGTTWNLQNTAQGGFIIVLGEEGTLTLYTATAGANPRTLTHNGTFTPATLGLAMDAPRALVSGGVIGTSPSVWTTIASASNVNVNSAGAAGGSAPWNNSTRTFTAPAGGLYQFDWCGSFAAAGGTIRAVAFSINGVTANYGDQFIPPVGGGNTTFIHTGLIIGLSVGSTVVPQVYQDTGAALNYALNTFAGRYLGPL